MENNKAFITPKIYDQLAKRMIPYDEIARLCQKKIATYNPGAKRILDIACGTGNLTIELAQLGYEVSGLDASAEMLELADQKSQTAELDIPYVHQDMTEPYPFEPADAVTCFYTALNYLTSLEQLEKCFQAVYNSLKPGGVFMFDQFSGAKMRRLFHGKDGGDLGNVYVVTNGSCDEAGQILNEVTYFQKEDNGFYSRIDEVQHLRIHPFEEIEAALTGAGLKLLEKPEMYPDEVTYRGFRESFLFVVQK